jgi:hypothetical protein
VLYVATHVDAIRGPMCQKAVSNSPINEREWDSSDSMRVGSSELGRIQNFRLLSSRSIRPVLSCGYSTVFSNLDSL